jgi:hypothetical protein
VWVADDGSSDGTAAIAEAAGARVVRSERVIGKGAAMTLAARQVLRLIAAPVLGQSAAPAPEQSAAPAPERIASAASQIDLAAPSRSKTDPYEGRGAPIVVLCDGDLGETAARLGPLADAVLGGAADMAVAVFSKRVGGGLGIAVRFAGWAIHRSCGAVLRAPISGQRALRASVLTQVLPFAHGYGMEVGMTIDAVRAGAHVGEVELDLSHRATGRTVGGFLHRGRQLVDFVRVYLARR